MLVPPSSKHSPRFCVVGAGSSGLTVAKNFLQAGIAFDCLERNDEVGGNWLYGRPHSSVYRSTHLISSKRLTEYTDFPMPRDWPEYPSQSLVQEYFREYALRFGLYDHIKFGVVVRHIEPTSVGWQVTLADGSHRHYHGVVIANGHHWDPVTPEYPGAFSGSALHSSRYKTPEVLVGKRVLVIGAGNSGCDIAVESAQHAARTFHSTRRGYFYVPKFLLGRPADRCGEFLHKIGLPLWLRRFVTLTAVKLAMGLPQDYGLPKPDHRFLETHPIVNSQMMYYVGHGDIRPKPDVARFDGQQVHFVDGSSEAVDLVIYATGYKLSFPFIDSRHLNWRNGRPELFLNVFHPTRDDLFVAGMIQPDSGQWGLVDYQAQLIAKFVVAQRESPGAADEFRRLKRAPAPDLSSGIHYVPSPRHLLEVEHFGYRRRLKKLIAAFP